MYTRKTLDLLNDVADEFVNLPYIDSIENVHLRGAMFGFYKAGSNVTKEDGKWPSKGLQMMKPGKLFRMMRGNEIYSDKHVEVLVNKIKSHVSIFGDEHGEGISSPNFSIVSGEMIGYYYLDSNYAPVSSSSNLMGSCMRYESCQPYFKFYENNHDSVSMLILRDDNYKIVSRALIWYDGKNTYMDTIYHITDAHKESMISYANKHGFYYKSQQSCHFFSFDMLNGKKLDTPKIVTIPVTIDENWCMPWLDTVMFIVKDSDKYYATNCISTKDEGKEFFKFRDTSGPSFNSEKFNIHAEERLLNSEIAFELLYGKKYRKKVTDYLTEKGITKENIDSIRTGWKNNMFYEVVLNPLYTCRDYKRIFGNTSASEGMVYVEGKGEEFPIEDCVETDDGEFILLDEAVEINGSYYHEDDENIRYSEDYGRYYHTDDVSWVESRQDYYPNSVVVFDEYNSEDIHENDAIYVDEYGYVHQDNVDDVAVYVDGDWHIIERCFQCEISDEWFLKSDKHQLPDGRSVCKEEYDNWMEENKDDEEENP